MSYSIEPVITDPSRRPVFYVTWESTLKCNLDCSYCGSHDNTVPHPSLEECKTTIDFLVEYINLYIMRRNKEQRHASINIFGGESLFHPHIVEILDYFEEKHKPYKDQWTLGLNTVTNAVVKQRIWDKIVDKIDYWTVSYHTESTHEQQELMRRNILDLKNRGKMFQVSILLHTKHWDNCMKMIDWCEDNDIPYLPRQIDHPWTSFEFYYTTEQAKWLREMYNNNNKKPACGDCSCETSNTNIIDTVKLIGESTIKMVNMSNKGRQCCGGIPLHQDEDYSSTVKYVDNKFKGWSCGVNYFYVFIKQNTKEIFTNKDCQMGFNGKVEPIGHLDNYQELLDYTKTNLENDTLPTITCAKRTCLCGICAPKAKDKETFDRIFAKYVE